MRRVVTGSMTFWIVGGLLLATASLGSAGELLLLGPLPTPPARQAEGPLAPKLETVLEVDPLTAHPEVGQKIDLMPGSELTWRAVEPGSVTVDEPGVYWLAGRLAVDRWAEVKLSATSGAAKALLFVDGVRWGEGEITKPLARGRHRVLARFELSKSAGTPLRLEATGDGAPSWADRGPAPPADLDAMRRLKSIGPVCVAPNGELVARRIGWRDPTGDGRHGRLDILAADGRVVAASVGGDSARPVAFLPGPDGPRLLLRQRGGSGTDLLVFDLASMSLRPVLRDEPDMAFVRWAPDGRMVLLASSRGVDEEHEDKKAAHRRRALREKLSDYVTRRQLTVVDVASGARRLLVAAGDATLDDAAFSADGSAVVYLRTTPREARPWFATDFHRIDLATGEDTVLGTFSGGWEGRPETVALSPDGSTVAFIGPPEEVGAGHAEHNVYNRQVWLLAKGSMERISPVDGPAATQARGELLKWRPDGKAVLVGVSDGSATGLAWLERGESGWTWKRIHSDAETFERTAVSRDVRFAAGVGSSRVRPADLRLVNLASGMGTVLEAPNARLAADWRLAKAEDLDLTGPSGHRLDAWWYAPTDGTKEGGVPLIVYYYGGATPTTRRFNTTDQVFAANGYTVLVVNPRGALGYGDRFADDHVDDWGPKASADILAAVDAFTTAHPEVDASRIGIYGGSFGGFMTEYLISHSDRFAAATAMYGISEIASYWGEGTWGWTYGDSALAGSFPWNRPELFTTRSPLFAADKIRTPLLLLHGEADVNVPEGESEQLYTALETLGRNVELVTFPGEDHGIAGNWTNWVLHRRMMLEFFDRWLQHRPDAWNHRWGLNGAGSEGTDTSPAGDDYPPDRRAAARTGFALTVVDRQVETEHPGSAVHAGEVA